MKLKAFAVLMVALMAFSCTNKKQTDKKAKEDQNQDQVEVVKVTQVTNQPDSYLDKKITVKGMSQKKAEMVFLSQGSRLDDNRRTPLNEYISIIIRNATTIIRKSGEPPFIFLQIQQPNRH